MSGRILIGDVRERLRELPDDYFDCVVTSPPYWGLRDYGTARWEGGDPDCEHEVVDAVRTAWANSVKGPSNQGKNGGRYANMTKTVGGRCAKCGAQKVDAQIGMEPTLGEHLEVMVEVFREVRRVLKPSGTLWLNYGDCYAAAPNGRSAADTKAAGNDDRTFRDKPMSTVGPIYCADYEKTPRSGHTENLGNTAAAHGGRVVAGGYLKPKDLCMIPNRLAIALQDDGWWVRSEIVWGKTNPMPDSARDRPAVAHEKIFLLTKSARYFYDPEAVRFGLRPKTLTTYGTIRTSPNGDDGSGKVKSANFGKTVPVRKPRQSAPARMDPRHRDHINHTGIDATPRGEGRNLRNYEPAPLVVWPMATRAFAEAHFATFPPELVERCLKAGCPENGTVLDPFGGAGTVGYVAEAMGLDCTLIELNPEYAEMAERRIASVHMGPAGRAALMAKDAADWGALFGAAAE